MRTFDNYLSEARRKQNASSNNQLAKILGISSNYISQLSQGKCLPSDETMIKIAELAEMDAEAALIDLAIWRSSGNENTQKTWLNLANKLALL